MPNEIQANWPTRSGRSTVSGRRRPIFTTARSRQSSIYSGPPEDRPKKFYLGNREYDPVSLGYKFDRIENGFEFDTSIRGNWNTGHEFRKEYSKEKEIKGVIGPALSPADRKALIEYLKTL